MSDLKQKLIRLGSTNPELRNDLRVVLRHLEASAEGEALAKEVRSIARSVRVTLNDMRADLGRRGIAENETVKMYANNLREDARRLRAIRYHVPLIEKMAREAATLISLAILEMKDPGPYLDRWELDRLIGSVEKAADKLKDLEVLVGKMLGR